MFIAFVAFVVADIPAPNSYWDYDSDSDGDASTSALASKYVEGDITNYYGQGAASYSGDGVADFYVSATVSYHTGTSSGSFWGQIVGIYGYQEIS